MNPPIDPDQPIPYAIVDPPPGRRSRAARANPRARRARQTPPTGRRNGAALNRNPR